MSLAEPAVASTVDSPSRLAFIDQLRALAALYVAVFHAALVVWPDGGPRPPLWFRWADYGHFSVAVFIVLSGFSLALKPAMKDLASAGRYWYFMGRRALRMLPPYWVALAGSMVLLAFAPHGAANSHAGGIAGEWSGKGEVPLRSVFAFTFLVQDLVHVPSPNSPLWSIAVEWHLYFLFPLLVVLGCRYGMKWMVGGCMAVGIGLHFALWETPAENTFPYFLGLFALGIGTAYAVAAARRSERPRHEIARISGWSLVAASVVVFAVITDPRRGAGSMRGAMIEMAADIIGSLVFAAGLYLMATRSRSVDCPPRRPKVVERGERVLAQIGLISYSLYLVHSPTEKIVWHFVISRLGVSPETSFVALAVAGVATSVAVAAVLHLIIERRSIDWSRRVRL